LRDIVKDIILLLVALCILSGCGPDAGSSKRDVLIIALPAEPLRLNPLVVSDLTSFTVSGFVFRGLVKVGDDLKIAGDLAESWDVSPDGRVITFHLRKGVLWQDGKEFTARDVLFTCRMLTSPEVPSPFSSQFALVKGIESPSLHTVRVTYREPFGSALMSWTVGILPEHRLSKETAIDPRFDRAPVGTGPYRLVEWQSSQKLVFEAFQQPQEPRIPTRRLIIRIIPDPATRLMELRKGTIDIAEITTPQLAAVDGNGTLRERFSLFRAPSMRYQFLGFNLLDSRFRDRRVRLAIAQAVDRKGIITNILKGYGSHATGPYPPGVWYADESVRPPSFDREGALRLLREAGWTRGEDGRLYRGGKPFTLAISTSYESEENLRVAQVIQDNLKGLGIDVKINQYDWQTFRHRVISHHDFEAVLLSRAYLWDPDLFDLWHSSKTGEGDWNYLSYRNPALDRFLERARRTVNEGERVLIYRRVHRMIAADIPCVFLYSADGLYLANRRVLGIAASPLGIYQNISRITVKP
jgi:peptide/nickel transport system substrate-binding protein